MKPPDTVFKDPQGRGKHQTSLAQSLPLLLTSPKSSLLTPWGVVAVEVVVAAVAAMAAAAGRAAGRSSALPAIRPPSGRMRPDGACLWVRLSSKSPHFSSHNLEVSRGHSELEFETLLSVTSQIHHFNGPC